MRAHFVGPQCQPGQAGQIVLAETLDDRRGLQKEFVHNIQGVAHFGNLPHLGIDGCGLKQPDTRIEHVEPVAKVLDAGVFGVVGVKLHLVKVVGEDQQLDLGLGQRPLHGVEFAVASASIWRQTLPDSARNQ